MVNLQDKPINVVLPIEIEQATNRIRLMLSELDWVSHPYHIAQRFYRKVEQRAFYYPETYVGGTDIKKKYHRLTPDNDYSGMFFFVIGKEENDFSANQSNFLTYKVGIIFSANLELIDKEKLKTSLFTQYLIRDVRRKLTEGMINFDFHYNLQTVTRDLKEVYREFVLDDIEAYNRAPMQCFRFDLTVTIQEDCQY
jgi:hypothetical protein